MLSPIETSPKEQIKHPEKSRTKPPATFAKKEKAKLPQNLENDALAALKEMLAHHKPSDVPNAVTPFAAGEKSFASMIATESSIAITKVGTSVQWTQLFDRMVKALIHVDQNGIQETTIVLNREEFSSSIFSGSQITITEFSTAPKIFNIHFQGGEQAVAAFQAHAADLARVFDQRKFGFEIGRIDATLPEEFMKKPLIAKIERDLEKEKK